MKNTARRFRSQAFHPSLLLVLLIPLLAGCPQYADPTVPEDIHRMTEPGTGRDYFLYVSSRYDPTKETPLVILCHGTEPWDSALRLIRDWVKLAEEKNFIVAAPKLKGTRGDFPPPVERQLRLQRADEETILNVVRHVSGAYNIDRGRVFLTGWSAGGYAVLHTGLRHADIFRSLAVIQGNFRSEYLADTLDSIDPYQPVFVLHGSTDVLTGGQSKACVDWLYEQNAYVLDGMVPGPHRSHPKAAYDFFERVVRDIPWLRIRAFTVDPAKPYAVQFQVRASFEPEAFTWSFGDGNESPVASPVHTYTEAGDYTVSLIAKGANGKPVKRSIQLRVPHTTLSTPLNQ